MGEIMTIEVVQKYDLLPGVDQEAYAELMKKVIAALLRAPGLVEIDARRNLLGSPQVRATSVWQSLADWEATREHEELVALEVESRRHVTNMSVEIWEPSPLLTQPLRPER
jgi:heme-degrading monooxygenase HmoA